MEDFFHIKNTTNNTSEFIEVDVIQTILDKIDLKAIITSMDGDIMFANKTFLDFYRLTQEQADTYKLYDSRFSIATEEQFHSTMDKILASKDGRLKFEYKIMRDSTDYYFEITILAFKLSDKDCYLYLSKDITELKKSQMQAYGLNKMLNKIIDNLPVYLFVKDVDDDLRYLIWNKAFAEYAHIPAEKVIGRTDFEVFPDYKDALAFRNDDLRVIEKGEMIPKQETYLAANGKTRVVQTFKTLVQRQDKGPILVGISLDITDIQGIEEELVRERLRAEESDRLKSRFLANMSHEIRTPLNAIVGFSGLLSDAEDDETRQQYLDIINENSELLLQLINDILDLSKIEAGTLEYTRMPMDLYDLCHNLLFVYREKMHNSKVKIFFDNDVAPSKFIINEDRNRLMQVVDNLLNNAVKFTESGEIHYGFHVMDDKIEVYVSDTGKGIPADKYERIFERFVKLDSFVHGSGLGLSICKLIVETLGGEISVSSELGKGSTFMFTIPYVKDKALNEAGLFEHKAEVKKHVQKCDGTILVAEDVYSNFLVVKNMIKGRYNILWAKDGEEAVEMAKLNNPDLVLMDIKMPIMNGLDATREIRKFNKDVPIAALTANAYDEDRQIARQAGMNNFLSKPINRDAFEAILNAYM